MDGRLTANGTAGGTGKVNTAYWSGGGGSGGSICIEAQAITGAGVIEANGGNGGWTTRAGGGAGGRIALYFDDLAFAGSIFACGGNGNEDGAAGSIFTKDKSQTCGELTVDNCGSSGARTPLPPGTLTLDGLHIANGAKVDLGADMELILTTDTFAVDDNVEIGVYTSVSYAGGADGKFSLVRVASGGLIILGDGAQLSTRSVELSSGGRLNLNAGSDLSADTLLIAAEGVFELNNDSLFDGSLVPVQLDGTLWLDAPVTFGSLQIGAGGRLTHSTGDEDCDLTITGDLTITSDGTIDVSGRGYGSSNGPGQGADGRGGNYENGGGGGAGHGGRGGAGNKGAGGL